MKFVLIPVAASIALMAAGCAATLAAPTQRLAETEALARSAKEVGAETNPGAKLELKLADEQITEAKALVASGENKRADMVLLRARADAELALSLAREQNVNVEERNAVEQSTKTFNSNTQGARP